MGLTRITSDGITDGTISTSDLADQSVTLAKLPHGTSSNNGKFLRANVGADPTFETINSFGTGSLVGDQSPQLGGDLQSNGNDIDFADNDKAIFGTGGDLELFFDGTHSRFKHTPATGDLVIQSDDIYLTNAAGNEYYFRGTQNGAAELYFDNSKKLETTSEGVLIGNGGLHLGDNNYIEIGNSDDFQIFHDGSSSRIYNATGDLVLRSASYYLNSANGSENIIKGLENGAVEIFHNGSKKFETTSSGVKVTGIIDAQEDIYVRDSKKIYVGDSNDLQLYHDGSNTYLSNSTGYLFVQSDNISLAGKSAGENYLVANLNGSVQLYYDNSKKFETKSTGLRITGNIHAGPSGTSFATDNDTYIFQAAAPSQAYVSTYAANDGTSLFNHGFHVGIDTTSANLIVRQSKPINFYTNDSHRLQLTSDGHLVPAATNTFDLGTTAKRWRNIYTNDLNLSNEGGSNDVDGTWGSYTIQEGAEDLFLVNKRNGKKYKFNLTEVS